MPPTNLAARSARARAHSKKRVKPEASQDFGFTFPESKGIRDTDPEKFRKQLVSQQGAIGMVQAKFITEVELDGSLTGTDLRLSEYAFGQLCHGAEVPVSFIKRLCKVEPATALSAMQAMIGKVFHGGATKMLVTDERTQTVIGVVGEKTYKPFSNVDAFDAAVDALKGAKLVSGTLDDGQMRASFVDPTNTRNVTPKAKIDDIIQMGVSAGNSIDGSTSAYIEEYNLRPVCTNGMTRRDAGGRYQFQHRNENLSDIYSSAAAAISHNYDQTCALMEACASAVVEDEESQDTVMAFVSDGRNGGGKNVAESAWAIAQSEAMKEGGNPNHPTLWNIVNGVTQVGRDTIRTQRRTDLEALGYRTMMRFGVPLLSN